MNMIIFLILFFICSGVVGALFNKKALSVFPVIIAGLLLSAYALALTNHLSRVPLMWLCFFGFVILGGTAILIYRKNTVLLVNSYKDAGIIIFALCSVFIYFAFRGHIVTNWDDFNYWANFPKNLYYSDAFVSGPASTTIFKDYMPIVQIYLYAILKFYGAFDEGVLFVAHNVLILTFLIPFFEINTDDLRRSVIRVFAGTLLIPAFSFQPFHCLGVDIIISAVFGYLLIRIFSTKNRDIWFYTELIILLSFLTLVKAMAIIVVAIVIILVWIDVNKKNRICILYSIASSIIPICFYFSWHLFCRIKGNTSYLSDKAISNVNGGAFVLPEYAGTVVRKYIEALLSLNLNGGKIGASAVAIMIFVIAIARYGFKDIKNKKLMWGIISVGFFGYLLSLLYTYLFVFEEWEALSLSSFDRYISLYLLGAGFACVYEVCTNFFETKETKLYQLALPVSLLISLNYSFLSNMLIPSHYDSYVSQIRNRRTEVEAEMNRLLLEGKDSLGMRVIIVNRERDDETVKYQQYALIPRVSSVEYDENIEDTILMPY